MKIKSNACNKTFKLFLLVFFMLSCQNNLLADEYFQLHQNFPAGSGPKSIITADFNKDQKLDFAVCNFLENNVSISMNNGDGTFENRVNYAAGTGPSFISSGDFNNDGSPDIVVCNTTTDSISILMNNENGTFKTEVDYPVGDGPYSVAVSDFNNDGYVDLAATNSFADNIAVLINNGDGTFKNWISYTVSKWPISIVAEDLNNDGQIDLAVTTNLYEKISILINKGDGTFKERVDYSVGESPLCVATGDFNHDGKADLAISNRDNHSVSVLINNGNGTFKNKVDYTVGLSPNSIIIADFDNNGDADIATSNISSDNISILLNNGDGTFKTNIDYSAGNQPLSFTVLDFDNDTNPDIISCNYDGNNMSFLKNNGDGTFRTSINFSVLSNPNLIITGDFNIDGNTDLVIGSTKSDKLSILINTGNGTFLKKIDYSIGGGYYPYAFATGDFNNDGADDIAMSNSYNSNISTLIASVDGTFNEKVDYPVGSDNSLVLTGNFNYDSNDDIAVLDRENKKISILINKGDGTFNDRINYDAGINPYLMLSNDFNTDGYSDIIIFNDNSTYLYDIGIIKIFLNNGDGTFKTSFEEEINTTPENVVTGDFNYDGFIDFAFYYSGLTIFTNNGDGTFYKVNILGGSSDFLTGDLNGDGYIDFISSDSILTNDGYGNFSKEIISLSNFYLKPNIVLDLVKDGHDDIAYYNSNNNTVSVLVNVLNNHVPSANDDTAETNEDIPIEINLTENDSDFDKDSLVLSSISRPKNGSIVNKGNGRITYTPDPNYYGTDSFIYKINDNKNGSSQAEVHITINPVNDIPAAVDDTVTTNKNTPVTVRVLENDSDNDGDIITITSVTQGNNGVVENYNSTVIYKPNEGYTGKDNFTYTISDNIGKSVTASVNVTILDFTVKITSNLIAGFAPLTVRFEATYFYGNNSIASRPFFNSNNPVIINYKWDCDNDGVFEIDTDITPELSHTFDNPGEYNVQVKATDASGTEAIDSLAISVKSNIGSNSSDKTNSGSKSNGSCLISSINKNNIHLIKLRDTELSSNIAGRILIETYYKISGIFISK